MKYGEAPATKTVTSGGIDQAPSQFNIQNSPIAFRTLSSGLYTDPVRAVIRELACNAYDAHVVVGKEKEPFKINLPTNFEPSFRIRDFGPGMSDEKVRSLYCTYFASDKTSRDDIIGALGLGSKSPFSYFFKNAVEGGFCVVSYQGGIARTYAAFIDNGYPNVLLQDESETTEPDGLEVTFPAEQRDGWEFENKARIALEFFDPMPNLNKTLDIHAPEYSIRAESGRWGLRGTVVTEQGSGVRAIMGPVAYAIGKIDVSRLTDTQKSVFEMPLDIFFQIGEVMPAASRESLQLDGKTIAAIKQTLDQVHGEILEQIKKKIDAASNMWEGRLVVWNLLQHKAISKTVNEAFNKGLLAGQYTGFNLSVDKDLKVNEFDYSSVRPHHYERRYRRSAGRTAMFLSSAARMGILESIEKGLDKRERYEHVFEVNPNVSFILDDMKPNRADRYVRFFVQEALDNPNKSVAYLLSTEKDTDQNTALSEISGLLAALGNPPVIMASSLAEKYARYFPKRTPAPREKGLLKFEERDWYHSGSRHTLSAWRKAWVRVQPDEIEDGPNYYVVVEGPYRTPSPGVDIDNIIGSPENLATLIARMRKLPAFDMDGRPVYGLRPKSKLLKDPLWIPLRRHLDTVVNSEMTPARESTLSLKLHPFEDDWQFVLDYLAENHPLPEGSKIQMFADELAAARVAAAEPQCDTLVSLLNTARYKVTKATDFNDIWRKVKAAYPLISICTTHSNSPTDEERDAMVSYLRMIEKTLQKPAQSVEPTKQEVYRARKSRQQKEYIARKKAKESEPAQVVTSVAIIPWVDPNSLADEQAIAAVA